MASFFAESNRLATVFGGDLAESITTDLEMTIIRSPHVSWSDIYSVIQHPCTALWLDHECVLIDARCCLIHFRHRRYWIHANLSVHGHREFDEREFFLYQAPAAMTERGAPLPALEYFLDRLSNHERCGWFSIQPHNSPNSNRTLDVSPACFLKLLETSRHSHYGNTTKKPDNSVTLCCMSLTAEQTALLFRLGTGPIFINLIRCRFHGPTLLHFGSTAREQTHHPMEAGRNNLHISLSGLGVDSSLGALLSNPYLGSFEPFFGTETYETVKNFVSALAANNMSRMEILFLGTCGVEVEWEREGAASMWIDLWKAIEQHPSLKVVQLASAHSMCQQSWWQPIAAAVKVNPRLVQVEMRKAVRDRDCTWKTKLEEHVEPLLERNRYRPIIAALCCTDPSKAAVLLGRAIVVVARKRNAISRREIHRMLLDQLVLTGYDFGVGRVLAEERPLAPKRKPSLLMRYLVAFVVGWSGQGWKCT